jgi:hypothetical protein
MKVEIERLDGSFGPFRIKMTADTDEDRDVLKILSGKVNITSRFQAVSWSGHGHPDTPGQDVTESVVLEEVS